MTKISALQYNHFLVKIKYIFYIVNDNKDKFSYHLKQA